MKKLVTMTLVALTLTASVAFAVFSAIGTSGDVTAGIGTSPTRQLAGIGTSPTGPNRG